MFRRTPLRPCPLLGLWLVFFVNGAVLSSWAPRIPEVKDRLALSDPALGAALFGVAAGSLPALFLTDRLLRRVDDRGVVAVLDSRMATARYRGYLRSSLPPFWATTDSAAAAPARIWVRISAGRKRVILPRSPCSLGPPVRLEGPPDPV